jgi:hypothetical protein
MLFPLAACAESAPALDVTGDASVLAENWILQQIENDTLFSFTYNGDEYAKHIRSWKKTVDKTEQGWSLSYVSKDDVTFSVEITYDAE